MTDPDLTTVLAGLTLSSPVLSASGCGGSGRELDHHGDLAALGAFTTRTLTLDARPGSATPRLWEMPSGVLWETGGQNPGLQGFLATELPWLAQRGVRTVVSVAGATLGEYAELARRVAAAPGVAALEVNLVSGNRDGHGRSFAGDGYQVAKVLSSVRGELAPGVPILAKLPPGPHLVDLARAAQRSGADAVVLVHGFPGLAFDPVTRRPALGGVTGHVSGPAVHAQALRSVWDVHAAIPDLCVVGVGGVSSGPDVVAMLLAGASAVQLGTVLLRDPSAASRITRELVAELRHHAIPHPAALVGSGHRPCEETP